jgi:type IV secretory pathway TraG/TraD family ATPase VirD4
MDTGKILVVNLAKGKIGEDSAALIGSLLISQMHAAALSRSDLPEQTRKDFFIYMDEFHTFTTKSLANMLAELRKYGVGLVLAHQYLSQLDQQVQDAILANAGTIITFRLGVPDARLFEKEFLGHFTFRDIINLPNYDIYLKLLIDGKVSRAFSATTVTD